MAKEKPDNTKILLTLPLALKQELEAEAEKEYRSLNNYITLLLVYRNERKPE